MAVSVRPSRVDSAATVRARSGGGAVEELVPEDSPPAGQGPTHRRDGEQPPDGGHRGGVGHQGGVSGRGHPEVGKMVAAQIQAVAIRRPSR